MIPNTPVQAAYLAWVTAVDHTTDMGDQLSAGMSAGDDYEQYLQARRAETEAMTTLRAAVVDEHDARLKASV